MNNFFTLQVYYTNQKGGIQHSVIEFKDLEPNGTHEKTWRNMVREKLFTTGFEIETSPGNYEFVSPFRVHYAMLLKQDKKYGI